MSQAQNLEKIGKKDMVKVNGGLNFNTIYLSTNNPYSKRDPFSWYLSGNLSLSVLDWSIPFSCAVSNQSRTFSQPFNQYGVMPTYKWIKLYAGWSNLSFTPYTMSGLPFLGGGVELTPSRWKFVVLYGRFKKAVEYDAVNEQYSEMSYRRMGMGAKVGYEHKGYSVGLILFRASDDPGSLKFIPDENRLQAQAGTVLSAVVKMPVTPALVFNAEYALSGFTRNVLAEDKAQSRYNAPWLFREKTSSEYFSAVKSSLTYNSKFVSLGINYERIDPGYKTLGAYYFNNDMENFTLSPQFRLLKNKLSVAFNGGLQRNNIDHQKLSTMQRFVGSGNVSFQPNAHWMFSGAYSNFTSYTRNRPNTDPFYVLTPADTMKFYQVSQSANSTVNYNITRGTIKHNVMLACNYQVSTQQLGALQTPPTNVYNANLAYAVMHLPSKFNVSLTGNLNKTEALNVSTLLYGPGLSLSKGFLKNTLALSLGSIYNASFTNDKSTGAVFSERLSLSFNPKVRNPKYGKPMMSLSCTYINKPKMSGITYALSEFTGNLNVGYSF